MAKKNYKLYKIGGCVRDALLGVESKDIDYTFEFTQEFLKMTELTRVSMNVFYITMKNILLNEGFEIFLETPECFTIRARFPKEHEHEGLTADFVLARKETYPDPNTRIPKVEIGTLYDDQMRRDFTVNTIAEDESGNLIDPFNGVRDLNFNILKCPVDPQTSFNDDPLRMLRAIRFAITKGFIISSEIDEVISTDLAMWDKFKKVVSRERVRDEIYKMMKHDSIATMRLLVSLDKYSDVDILNRIFEKDLWLEPTFKKR